MQYRNFGKTGLKVSEVSLGTWQIGGKWGEPFNHQNAEKILNHAIDQGINFIDTADVYGEGESEKAVGKVLKERREEVYFATKCGRKLKPHVDESYQPEVLKSFVEDSLTNMGLEKLDLIQLHCPPSETYDRPEIFEVFDDLKSEGKIRHFGVSVEKVSEALKAMEYPNVETVQIIFNIFRQKPSEAFFKAAREKNIGIIVRVPLASGLLTGKLDKNTRFSEGDHRFFNREGQVFDKGETFSGVDYDKGLEAVEELKELFPDFPNLAPVALKWILMFDEVSCTIPGASRVEQLDSNLQALEIPDFSQEQMKKVREVYEKYIKPDVHHLW